MDGIFDHTAKVSGCFLQLVARRFNLPRVRSACIHTVYDGFAKQ